MSARRAPRAPHFQGRHPRSRREKIWPGFQKIRPGAANVWMRGARGLPGRMEPFCPMGIPQTRTRRNSKVVVVLTKLCRRVELPEDNGSGYARLLIVKMRAGDIVVGRRFV
jgi:hypothetical protein